jgi:CpeT/CpcT family (DUF1001)
VRPTLRRATSAALLCFFGAVATPAAAQTRTLADELQRFASWFAGEWNNNEQVWQEKIDLADPKVTAKPEPHEHVHHIFAPVAAPGIGAQVFYVQQALAADLSKPYRQRLYRFSVDNTDAALKLEIFRFKDEAAMRGAHLKPELFKTLTLQELIPTPGCEVWWRFDAADNAYTGTMKKDACSYVSPRSGQRITVNDTLKLNNEQIWINDQATDANGQRVFGNSQGVPSRNRKLRYFEGWVWIKNAGPTAAPDDKKTSFTRKMQLHSEGARAPVMFEDGSMSPYDLELALLTYQNTKKPILKFALLERATGKSVSYTWANTDASLIGMNLGWFQSGMTQKSERVNFGF